MHSERGSGTNDTTSSWKSTLGTIFHQALIANTNLGGDNINRGIVLGTILGSLIGESNIPIHCVQNLYRYQELCSVINLFVEMVKDSLTHGNSSVSRTDQLVPSFGRPRFFPFQDYTSSTRVRSPVDFKTKLTLLHQYIQRLHHRFPNLPVCDSFVIRNLQFFRHARTNPFLIVSIHDYDVLQKEMYRSAHVSSLNFITIPKHEDKYRLIAYEDLVTDKYGKKSVELSYLPLDTGEAAKDRAEVLQQMNVNLATTENTPSNKNSTEDRKPFSGSDPYAVTKTDLLQVSKYIDNWEVSTVPIPTNSESIREPFTEIEQGTGMMVYANPSELQERLSIIQQQRGHFINKSHGAVIINDQTIQDPVVNYIYNEYQQLLTISLRSPFLFQSRTTIDASSNACQ